jgi:hypothetical protein
MDWSRLHLCRSNDVYFCEWSDGEEPTPAVYRLTTRGRTGPVWRYVSREKLDVALKELSERTVNIRITLLED